MLTLLLKNRLDEIPRLHTLLKERAERLGLSPELSQALEISLDEILTNIISHGFDDGGEREIAIRLRVERGSVTVEVEDDGKPFDPLAAPPPDITSPLEERAVGGLGIYLVRKLMDGVRYRREGNRNILTLTKRKIGATHGDR